MSSLTPSSIEGQAYGFPRRGHYLLAAVVMTVLFVYGSFVPLEYQAIRFTDAVGRFRAVRYLHLTAYHRADFMANLLLLVPLGYLWLGALIADRRGRYAAMLGVVLVGVLLAAVIVGTEFAQLWFPRRTVSLNDILAESVGACIGMACWLGLGSRATAWLRRFLGGYTTASDWRISLLRLYAVGLWVYMAMPLDFVISPEELRHKLQRGGVVLIPFSSGFENVFVMLWQVIVDVILYIPIGVMMRVDGTAPGKLRSLPRALAMAMGFVVGVELIQLFLYSRFADTTDVITGGVGAWVGAVGVGVGWRRWKSSDANPGRSLSAASRVGVALLLLGLYLIPMAASFWYPFDWDFDRQRMSQEWSQFLDYPFRRHYWGHEYVTMVNLVRNVMLFVPIGVLLRWGMEGVITRPTSRRLLGVAWVLAIGLLIEWGQVMTITRLADVTDLFIYLIGAGLGGAVTGRLLKR